MRKLLIFCFAVLLAGVPVSTVSAAAPETSSIIMSNGDVLTIDSNGVMSKAIVADESYTLSPDASSMHTSITMEYPGEVTPNRSVTVTRIIDGNTYTGTVYLISYWYIVDTNVTTANYEGTLYLQSSTSTS